MSSLERILDLLSCSLSPFHVVALLRKELLENGFLELFEEEDWHIEAGKKYFVTRNGSSLLAFKIPQERKAGFHFTMAHTDSPTFKVKPHPIVETVDGIVLNVEPYGGMINSTWLDRPLALAGRLIVQDGQGIRPLLFGPNRDLMVIPNLCIHMNRTVNEGMRFNNAKDMLPLISLDKFDFLDFLSEESHVEKKDILGFDLFLVNRDKPRLCGLKEEFLSSPKLDDLSSLYTSFLGFLKAHDEKRIPVFAGFDNEEVGSQTRQGAHSTFLRDTMARLTSLLPVDMNEAMAASISLSIDNAHANHPNHPEISDQTTKVLLGKGIAIKHSARQSYTTDALSCSFVKVLCQKSGIGYQEYTDRSDLRGGSTLGNLSNSEVSLLSCDIGIPQLAMHSSNELCAVKDLEDMIELTKTFFEVDCGVEKGGIRFE